MCTILAKGPSIARSHAALRHVFPFAPTFLRRSSRINAVPHSFNVSPDEASRALPGVSWGLRYDAEPGIDVLTPPIPNDGGDELEPYRSADAIVVLAGGQDGAYALPSWVERRLDAALSLHKLQRTPCPVLCLGGGTPHKPPFLDDRGYVVHEGTSCAEYLMQRGVPAEQLLKEVSSYDTVGNAYFSLTIHAVPAAWRRLIVVTSDFHMPRTASLFCHMYRLAGQDMYGDPDRFQFRFVAASDVGLFEPDILQARRDKEAASRRSWLRTSAGLSSLRQLHAWLHATHLCYAVGRQAEFGVQTITDPKLLASY